MRKTGKIDANQPAIVKTLKDIGCSVQILSAVGGGCTDLLVGVNGYNLCLEVKDGAKPPSGRVLTPAQAIWHRDWRGHKAVVTSEMEAIQEVERWKKLPNIR